MHAEKITSLPKLHKTVLASISAVLVIVILTPSQPSTTQHPDAQYEVGKPYRLPLEISALMPEKKEDAAVDYLALTWRKFKIQPGESLSTLFTRTKISPTTLHRLINSDERTQSLSRLKVGDEIHLGFDEDKQFVQLIQILNANQNLVVSRIGSDFCSKIESKQVDMQINYAAATIRANFWNAGINAGLTPNQIMELAGLFGWDIDFALDVRPGDNFSVLYEEQVVEGDVIGRGNILAATFTNQGQKFTAIRSEDGKYYDENGQAMRKAFLRSPVNFRYVSSNFNPSRLHPVTGTVKAHRGTDYVAPVGTPIWAAGDGVVMESSYNRFNGHYVFIRHNSTYITKYLHLTKRSVKKGERVRQGDTVGTLGGTGRVSGPHLHYEFLVNGIHKNPRTVTLPQAESLQGKARQVFIEMAQRRLEQLENLERLQASTYTPREINRS